MLPQRIARRFRRGAAAPGAFEREFALEVLESDRLRVTILIGVVIFALLIQAGISIFAYEQFQRAFHGNFGSFQLSVLSMIGLVLACLLAERAAIARMIRQQRRASTLFRYLSAFFETSIPTLTLLNAALFLGPVYTLSTPPILMYPIFIVLSALRLDFKLCVFTGAVAGLEYSALAVLSLNQPTVPLVEPILSDVSLHIFKGLLLVLTAVVTGFVTLQIKKRSLKSFEVLEERNRISRTFGEYVSPAVMDKLLTLKPDLRSEKKNVCVMFLDIRNFTAYAEKRSPEEVVDYLESLFEFMVEIVNRHHGIVNKFLGDGFMAVFGAPLSDGADCLNGLAAAREILSRVESEVADGRVLPTTVGIGLHAGEAVTGSIGSSVRREYTVIGDVVNLAARIEQLNKQLGSQLLISEVVWESIGEDSESATPMGRVQVKGREAPIQVYQVA
ncbi:MAG TPA: adenylate/guanylate cyclase domain-containing protein [Pyrinomonadaceae bacterium]|nr:adenylate/guanylate cyclase domain-containing protein [Pyrinomonadaceae bacterium]